MAGKAKPKPKTSRKRAKSDALDPEKVAEIVDYRSQGYSSADIAAELKMSIDEVIEHLNVGLSDAYEEPPNFHVRLEIKRLQNLQRAMMAQASAGDVEATKQVLVLEAKIARAKMQLFPDMRELFGDVTLWRQINIDPTKKNKGGRPPHQPTQATIKAVESLALVRTPVKVIAKVIGTGEDQIRKHYAVVLETARTRLLAAAGGTIVDAIYKGDANTSFKVLERVGPKEWQPPVSPTFDKGKVDPAGSIERREVVVHGGLPAGSTADNPGGDAQAALDAEAGTEVSDEAKAAHHLMKPPDAS